MAEDFRQHYVLWLAIVGAIIPAVFAALNISSNASRLTVTLEAKAVLFQQGGATEPVSADVLDAILDQRIRDTLEARVKSIFEKADSSAGSETKNPADKDSLYFEYPFPKVKVRVRSEVTNIGNRPSSLQFISWYIFEEIDGRRELRDFVFQSAKHVGLPEGQPVQVLPENGDTIEFGLVGVVWTDYEVFQILSEKIRAQIPKGQNLLPRIRPYLEVLAMNEPIHRDRILNIADPTHDYRLVYEVHVSDIYGRTASTQVVWVDSHAFNRGR